MAQDSSTAKSETSPAEGDSDVDPSRIYELTLNLRAIADPAEQRVGEGGLLILFQARPALRFISRLSSSLMWQGGSMRLLTAEVYRDESVPQFPALQLWAEMFRR